MAISRNQETHDIQYHDVYDVHQPWRNPSPKLDAGLSLPISNCNLPFGIRVSITMDVISTCCSQEEYLNEAHTHQKETGGRYIPLFDILKELLLDAVQPDEAAIHVSSFIFSNDDSLSVYSGVLSTIIAAAHELSEPRDLEKLANLTLALSRLPDMQNESHGMLRLYFNLKYYDIAPGQVIEFDDGEIWSGLPGFATNLGDCMRGISHLLPEFTPILILCSRSYSIYQRRHT